MLRKPSLAATFACAALIALVIAAPAFAGANPPDGGGEVFALGAHGLVVGLSGLAFALLAAAAILASVGRLARSVVTLAVVLIACPVLAHAAEAIVAATTPGVILPYGDWIVAIGQAATSILVPVLAGVITTAVYQVAPWLRLFLTQQRIETMIRNVADYGHNAVDGAVKGQVLTIPTGSAVIAKAV